MKAKTLPILFGCLVISLMASRNVAAQSTQTPYKSSKDFAKYAERLRESALLNIEPQVLVPTASTYYGGGHDLGIYPWKLHIVTTIFWVGEQPTQNNPVPNTKSSWDPHWTRDYGGSDSPSSRRGYIPAAFVPQQNPFYVALPYNDVEGGRTKPEAYSVIPWFKHTFQKSGESVCKDRWIEIRHGSRTCYAQWEDCGPFRTDHWQYVFGNQRPKWNLNQGAGLDVSPAVRDFLGLSGKDVCDWKFVEFREVPNGPWAKWGNNNTFVINGRHHTERVAEKRNRSSPHVIIR